MDIASARWDGQMVRLLHKDGTPAKVGDEVTTFRGEKVILMYAQAPWKTSSMGRVYVKGEKGEESFFPSVVDCKWEGQS